MNLAGYLRYSGIAGMKRMISASTPTRVTGSSTALLDHVYVTHPERIIQTLVPINELSDHYVIIT